MKLSLIYLFVFVLLLFGSTSTSTSRIGPVQPLFPTDVEGPNINALRIRARHGHRIAFINNANILQSDEARGFVYEQDTMNMAQKPVQNPNIGPPTVPPPPAKNPSLVPPKADGSSSPSAPKPSSTNALNPGGAAPQPALGAMNSNGGAQGSSSSSSTPIPVPSTSSSGSSSGAVPYNQCNPPSNSNDPNAGQHLWDNCKADNFLGQVQPLQDGDACACQQACDRKPNCAAWTWENGAGGNALKCMFYKLSANGTWASCKPYCNYWSQPSTWGYPSKFQGPAYVDPACQPDACSNLRLNTDFQHATLQNITMIDGSPRQCCDACRQNLQCVKYTFDLIKGICALKGEGTIDVPTPNLHSGRPWNLPSNCKISGYDKSYGGQDITGMPIKVDHAGACAKRCASRDACVMFSFFTSSGQCFLKNNNNVVKTDQAGVISGDCTPTPSTVS